MRKRLPFARRSQARSLQAHPDLRFPVQGPTDEKGCSRRGDARPACSRSRNWIEPSPSRRRRLPVRAGPGAPFCPRPDDTDEAAMRRAISACRGRGRGGRRPGRRAAVSSTRKSFEAHNERESRPDPDGARRDPRDPRRSAGARSLADRRDALRHEGAVCHVCPRRQPYRAGSSASCSGCYDPKEVPPEASSISSSRPPSTIAYAYAAASSPAKRRTSCERSLQPGDTPRRGGRVVEGTRLESGRTLKAYREFESHPLRVSSWT